METSREYTQYILDVLADIWGRENGVEVKLTLKPENEKSPDGGEAVHTDEIGRGEKRELPLYRRLP